MSEEKKTHASYGQLNFSRVHSGGGHTLYGSSIKPSVFIRMELSKSSLTRSLNSDYHFKGDSIVTVDMTQNQFAELITNMNSSGVPVTLSRLGKEFIAPPPDKNQTEEVNLEFKEHILDVFEHVNSIAKMATDKLLAKGNLKVADRMELAKDISLLLQDVQANIPFIEKRFRESMDNTVADAKGTIDAYVQNKIDTAGIESLGGSKMMGIDHDD